MRIIFLTTQDMDSPSGLGRVLPLGKALSQRGVSVQIAALHSNFASLETRIQHHDALQINYVGQMHVLKVANTKEYFRPPQMLSITAQATWKLFRAALQFRPDIIHVAKPHPMNSLAGYFASKLLNVPLFLDCDDYEAASGRFKSSWEKTIVTWFEKWAPRVAQHVTTNTSFMRDRLASWDIPAGKITLVPNGIDRERFAHPELSHPSQIRRELGLQNQKIIVYIGSLSLPSHPVDILLNAFARVCQQNKSTALLIVGAGEDYSLLIDQAKALGLSDRVIFTGRVRSDKVLDYYKVADVSIDPVYDNDAARGRSPLKIFESWASGIPVVTSDVGDRKLISGEPPASLFAEPGNPDSLAACILQLLDSPQISAELVRLGFERVKSFYWDQLASSIFECYNRILDGNKDRD